MPMFNIIYGDQNVPKEQWNIYASYISDPRQAAEEAKALNAYAKRYEYSTRYMLQRVPDDEDFIAREHARTDFTPFEVQGEAWHLAELKGAMISYYQTKARAVDDKRTETKLGRYLREWTELDDNEIADICARNGVVCGDAVLKFARTREEIRAVYEKGPRSCMSATADEYYAGGIHPAEAYASPDLAVAYVERDDEITARAVCFPEKKIYTYAYGDDIRMDALMQAEGYRCFPSEMVGARLLKLSPEGMSNRYACPYLDFGGSVRRARDGEDDNYLYVAEDVGSDTSEDGYILDRWLDDGYDEDDD